MRSVALLLALAGATWFAYAQGGSGAPSSDGQSVSPKAASAAESAVEPRHEKVEARNKTKAAKRAAKAASAKSD